MKHPGMINSIKNNKNDFFEWSDNNIIKVHINKIEVFSSDIFNLELNSSDLIFGAQVNSIQTIETNFWTGYIDEIRLWNKALSDEEIS